MRSTEARENSLGFRADNCQSTTDAFLRHSRGSLTRGPPVQILVGRGRLSRRRWIVDAGRLTDALQSTPRGAEQGTIVRRWQLSKMGSMQLRQSLETDLGMVAQGEIFYLVVD